MLDFDAQRIILGILWVLFVIAVPLFLITATVIIFASLDRGGVFVPLAFICSGFYAAGALGCETPTMQSRVTSSASFSSDQPSVPSGRAGSTR